MKYLWLTILLLFCSILPLQAQLHLQQLAHVPNDSAVTLAGCWHYVDSFDNEYALVGTSRGLDIYNMNIPTQPVRKFQVPGLTSNWREVREWGGYAYVGSEANGSGITIVDMRYFPDSIRWKVWYGEGQVDSLIRKSHTVGAVDGYLYVYGSFASAAPNGGIICSLEDPWNPTFTGHYTGNYLHDGYVRGDTLWGSEIYQGQFSVVDISDRANPQILATQPTPGGFNHNSELSKDGQFLFVADEKPSAPLGAFDVSQLDNITLTDTYLCSQKPSGEVHNVRVFGEDFLVCPSYEGQLTIVDASDPYNLIETAWVVMGNSLVWDANPYLPSGIIFATAKNEGLFIYKPQYVRAARLSGTVTDAATGVALLKAKVFVENTANADTTNLAGYYATGAPQSGTYTVRVEKEGYFTHFESITLTEGDTITLNVALQQAPVGVSGLFSGEEVSVYPSVTTGGFTVDIPEHLLLKNTQLQVWQASSSQLMLEMPVTSSKQFVSGQLNAGVYLVGINGRVVGRVVVAK